MARAKVAVPKYLKPRESIQVEPGATDGATVGVNVFNPDGSLWVPSGSPQGGSPPTSTYVYWRNIREVPVNVVALAETSTAGIYVITGDGTSATRAITGAAGEIEVENGDGVAGDPVIGLADVAPEAGGAIRLVAFDAKGRRSHEDDATTDDLGEGALNLYFTDERAQDAIGSILANSATIQFTYDDGVPSIVADAVPGGIPHNSLAGLQGGAPGERVHLTAAEYGGLAPWAAIAPSSKEPAISAGTAAQFWRGDKSWGNTLTEDVGSGGPWQGPAFLYPGGASGGGLFAQRSVNTARLGALSTQQPSQFLGLRCEGTLAAPAQTGSVVGVFDLYASTYTGSGWVFPAGISCVTREVQSPSGYGTCWKFGVTQLGDTLNPNATALTLGLQGNLAVSPGFDNFQPLGNPSFRWSVVYAATGTINTSDAREKTEVKPLSGAEIAAASELSRTIGTYQWLEALSSKGDAARLHVGMTVQGAMEIMRKHGLDPLRYGFICYDRWDAQDEVWHDIPSVVADDGTEIAPPRRECLQPAKEAGDRYSFRMDELCLFIARGLEARISAIESATTNP